jgi:hypothetical protein
VAEPPVALNVNGCWAVGTTGAAAGACVDDAGRRTDTFSRLMFTRNGVALKPEALSDAVVAHEGGAAL